MRAKQSDAGMAGDPESHGAGTGTGVDGMSADVSATPADLSGRGRMEATRRESEARYHVLFDSIDQGFCVLEVLFDGLGKAVDYRFVEANRAFVQETGLSDVVGRRMRELAPEHEEYWFEIYGRVALTGEPIRFEAPAEALGRFYDLYAFRIGRPEERHVAVLFHDVSAARRAEGERERLVGALEVERARLAEVFRRAPSFVAVFRGPELRYEFVNEAYYELVGQRDLLGRPLLDGLPELRNQGFIPLLSRVREVGEAWVGRETPVVLQRSDRAEPETRYLDMVFQALTEADGTRTGVVVHGSDVTEQVLAWRQVEATRAEVETILESISDAFYAVDSSFRFTYVNRKAEELWGRCREELLGRNCWEEFPASAGSESHRMHQRVMEERQPVRYETISPLLERWIEASLYPAADGGLSCYFRGITDRKAAEEERERLLAAERAARADAEAANRAKAEFLAVMSHELRTPLNAIDGYAELMELGIRGPLTEEQRQDLGRIRKSQRHLLGLVNGVLNYSRVEAGAVRYGLDDVPVHLALATCEALVAPQARARGLTLLIGACDPWLAARADREKMEQIVLNLLTNAVKFTDAGGRVDVACATADGQVAIVISDTGRGIAPEQLDRVFEPFVQVDASRTRTSDGVGLGLAISRDLARGMGGNLTVESTVGEGSRFTLTLPRSPDAPASGRTPV